MSFVAYFRSLVAVLLIFPPWTFVCCCLVMISQVFPNRRELTDDISQMWAKSVLLLFGVRLEIIGSENIPKGSCLFLFNHSSFMDIFALEAAVRGIRFGAKIELFKIPFFGWAMRAYGILPIARDRREDVMRVYSESVARAHNGEKFALAPEGKRNTEPKTLLPFKSGPFIFAIQAQMPVVPVVLKGASDIWPKNALVPQRKALRSTVRIEFLPAVSTTNVDIKDRNTLAESVRQMMLTKV